MRKSSKNVQVRVVDINIIVLAVKITEPRSDIANTLHYWQMDMEHFDFYYHNKISIKQKLFILLRVPKNQRHASIYL